MTLTTLVIFVSGVLGLMVLRVWALGASPSWVAKRIARGKTPPNATVAATYRRRLLIYYATFALFIGGLGMHAFWLKRRAAELQRLIDSASHR